ncbi:GNAT family N-acetyltransferase [Saccharothrix syringae]|uniref:N-acetyltransferase n=1 Tax=Saccharothrix syringae TaxID=103733 RepID=A0A5Q0GWR7_SACSY|nr:GNAT family N-acetyltransferase [Saccharothrix syringae]QFZ18381.1 N-acetyltransferase [Saccharothrix syringae]
MSALQAEVIATERLDLVPLRVEHATEMAEVLSDPALHAFTGGAPDSPRELRRRYGRLTAGSPDPGVDWLNWVVALRAEDRLVGTVQATRVHDDHTEIAWVVGTPWQGRGIAAEAARALVDWLRGKGVRTVVAHVHPDHHASAAVATAAGLAPTDRYHDGEVEWRSTPRTDPAADGPRDRG